MIENYLLINRHTLAIRKIEHPEFQTEVMYADGVIYSTDSPVKMLFDYCIRTGSSLRGNMDAAKFRLGVEDPIVPIILNPFTKLMVMPTHVPNKQDNVWIFPNHVSKVAAYKDETSVITFVGGRQCFVRCQVAELNGYLDRAERLEVMADRKNMKSFLVMRRKDRSQ